MSVKLFDDTYTMLSKSMDISARKHELISSNIANVDTVGYKPRDIDFHKTLVNELNRKTVEKRPMAHTDDKHYQYTVKDEFCPFSLNPDGIEPNDFGYDVGHVNIDTEMTNLAENNIKYKTSIEMLLRKISVLKHSIVEGGGR